MADHPWRCSQCGTINEPVANSCRNCGKWPSLFDLEDKVVEEVEAHTAVAEPELHEAPEPRTVEVETFEPKQFELGQFEPEPMTAEQAEPKRRRMFEPPKTQPVLEGEETRRARWISWLVPLAFVVYIVISYAFSGR
jgi:hypothetical protein